MKQSRPFGAWPFISVIFFYVGLFVVDFLFMRGVSLFGVQDKTLETIAFGRYAGVIIKEQIKVFAAYIVIGLIVGLLAQLVVLWWRRSFMCLQSRKCQVLTALGLAAIFHLLIFVHTLVHLPALFVDALYRPDTINSHRAFTAVIMHFLTRHISTGFVERAAISCIVFVGLLPFVKSATRFAFKDAVLRIFRRLALWKSLGALAMLVAIVGGWGVLHRWKKPARTALSGQQSVLIIGIDSLRADRLFAPRYGTVTPHLRQLASHGVQFQSAFVTVPRTFPSLITLLTGRYPHHHGIRTMFPTKEQRANVGSSLPQVLRDRGYSTSVVSDFAGEIFSRVNVGFQHTDVPYFDASTLIRQASVTGAHINFIPYATSSLGGYFFPSLRALPELALPEKLTDTTIDILTRASATGAPFFHLVFYSTAHFPYSSSEDYYNKFSLPEYNGPFAYNKPPLAGVKTHQDKDQVRALYDGAISSVDASVGRLLEQLKSKGLLENTIVILLADHGENLYDFDSRGMGHGEHLEGSDSVQVPLIIYAPKGSFVPHRVSGVVRDIDVAPTIMTLLGESSNGTTFDGTTLLPLLRGQADTLNLKAFTETELWFTESGAGFGSDLRLPYPIVTKTADIDADDDIVLAKRWHGLVNVAKHRSLRTDKFKLIYRPTRKGIQWSFYDVAADPEETLDARQQYPLVFSGMKQQLLNFLQEDKNGHVLPSGYWVEDAK